jgi:hypothetical protein
MKKVFFILSVVLSAIAHAEEVEVLSNDTVPFVYESRVKNPISNEMIADILVPEYHNARDEFSKRELFAKIDPDVKNSMAEAKAKSNYSVRVNVDLGQYDFDNKRFPSGFTSATFIPFSYNFSMLYALLFDNVKEIEFIPIPLDVAKTLSEKLQRSRTITAVVYCRITGTDIRKLQYEKSKVLLSHITKVDFLSDGDSLIATVTPK